MRIEGYKESDEKDLLYVWEESAKIAHGFIDEELQKTDILRVWNEYSKKLKTYVAKEEDILCGFLSMYGNNIAGIFVAPEWQRKQIGKSLIEHAKKDRMPLSVEVFCKNTNAIRFYEKMGFRKFSEYMHPDLNEILWVMKMEED